MFVSLHQDGKRLRELAEEVAARRIPVPIARRMPLEAAVEAHHLVEAGGLGGGQRALLRIAMTAMVGAAELMP